MTKVIIGYDTPDGKHITKVWRFDANSIQLYWLKQVKSDVLEFFPSISQRRLGISLSYNDSLVGAITLESDANLQVSSYYEAMCVHDVASF